jgi:hypothetical protein
MNPTKLLVFRVFSRLVSSCLILIFLIAPPASGQSNTLPIRVCARDAAGNAPLPGAAVTARNGEAAPVSGTTETDGCIGLDVPLATSTGIDDAVPEGGFRVGPAYPQPTGASATLPFWLPDTRTEAVSVFDVLGRLVGGSESRFFAPGAYAARLDVSALRSGLYLYRVMAGDAVVAGRLVKIGGDGADGEAAVTFISGPAGLSVPAASAFAAATLRIVVERAGYVTQTIDRLVEEGEEVTVMLASDAGSTNERIPLDMMGPNDTYYGLKGGLVDNGAPTVEATNGKIVIIAISMSNGFQEFSRFMEVFGGHPDVSEDIVLINCAVGGSALESWLSEQTLWERCKDDVNQNYSVDQVKVVWAKDANQDTADGITLPDAKADYYDLIANIGALSQKIGDEFPSVQAIFHSSRIYGGYVEEQKQAARGEPISYEGGFAINATIEKWQRGELPGAPWIGWGPYIWANGTAMANASGIVWERTDFQGMNGDNQHPSQAGATKVADALHAFFMQFDWYRR